MKKGMQGLCLVKVVGGPGRPASMLSKNDSLALRLIIRSTEQNTQGRYIPLVFF